MFKPKVYRKRRKKIAKQFDSGILLFIGNDESDILVRDTVHKFRQNSNFLYYWGINEPGLTALIDIENNVDILFGHDLITKEIVWEGEQTKLADKAKSVGVAESAEKSTLKEELSKYIIKGKQIHYLPQIHNDNIYLIEDLLNIPSKSVNQRASIELTKAVIEQRSVKTKAEITEIEKALRISYKLHALAMRKTEPGKSEHQIVQNMEKMLLTENSRWAYLPIFTTDGERLHNHHYTNRLQNGKLVINDAGAESTTRYYSSDITRTFPVNGKFSKKQRAIYEIVLKAQMASIKKIKPGIKYLDIHLTAARVIAKGLKSIGIMRGDYNQAVQAGAQALFFPHGLGHLLGLDVHDMEDLGEDFVGYNETIQRSEQFGLAYLRFAQELKIGHVLTVEPGIYFIPQLIKKWQNTNKFNEFISYDKVNDFLDFGGVRIEDDVLVTKTGCRVLGKPIPKTVVEIEKLMNHSNK